MILKKISINATSLTNLTFAFFPISFILGNLIINLNILLFCCLGIFHLRSKILKTNYNFPIKIILSFFFIVFFSTSLDFIKILYTEGYEYKNLVTLIKSVTFFRFFLMLLIVYLLSEFGILNFKYFFISAAFFPILVSIDIIFQYFFGFNLIGLEGFKARHIAIGRYNSGFFGDELIAGSYVKNFSFFSILFLSFKLVNKKNIQFILTAVVICILGFGILLAGNKMPIPLFLLGLFLLFFFSDNLKKIILVGSVSLFIIFYLTSYFDETKKRNFSVAIKAPKYIITQIYNKFLGNEKNNNSEIEAKEDTEVLEDELDSFGQLKKRSALRNIDFSTVKMQLFYTAIDLWKQNKIFGNGIKSFRRDCGRLQEYRADRLCSNHPHNYYIEILTETGIVGLFVILTIGLLFIIFIFKNFRSLRGTKKENLILLAATISLLIEVFPIRSTGSVFTTHNATYLVLIASIILSCRSFLNAKNLASPNQ